jgi:hypothetical protein
VRIVALVEDNEPGVDSDGTRLTTPVRNNDIDSVGVTANAVGCFEDSYIVIRVEQVCTCKPGDT